MSKPLCVKVALGKTCIVQKRLSLKVKFLIPFASKLLCARASVCKVAFALCTGAWEIIEKLPCKRSKFLQRLGVEMCRGCF